MANPYAGGRAGLSNRAPLFGGAGTGAGGGAQPDAADQVRVQMPELDVDSATDALHSKVGQLKGLAGALREEVSVRDKLLNDLEANMIKARAAVQNTLRKMNIQYNIGGGTWNVLVVVVFALVLFLTLIFFRKVSSIFHVFF